MRRSSTGASPRATPLRVDWDGDSDLGFGTVMAPPAVGAGRVGSPGTTARPTVAAVSRARPHPGRVNDGGTGGSGRRGRPTTYRPPRPGEAPATGRRNGRGAAQLTGGGTMSDDLLPRPSAARPPGRRDAPPPPVTRSERWLARLAWLAALAALVLLVLTGFSSITALVAGVAGLAVMLAATWWFLSSSGPVRWLAGVLAVAAPVVVIVIGVSRHVLWQAVLLVGLA